jgi:hypothetical protein
MVTTDSTTQTAVPENRGCARICPKFSYGLMLVGLIALAASGIGTFLLGTPPMTHWILMAHVGSAPVFAIGSMLVALIGPARCAQQSCCGVKLFFWLMLLCSLVVILSGVVPMTPIFGTEGQHLLYLTHRYSAMVLTVLVILHCLSLRRKAS